MRSGAICLAVLLVVALGVAGTLDYAAALDHESHEKVMRVERARAVEKGDARHTVKLHPGSSPIPRPRCAGLWVVWQRDGGRWEGKCFKG